MSIQTALVAHPDGATVIPRGMCPLLMEGTTGMNHAVTGHIVMVADGGEPSCLVTGNHGFQGERPVAARGAAMDDNQVYPPVVLVLRTG